MNLRCNSCDGIYNKCLDVRFTKACDNSCSFCIEKCGADSFGKTEVQAMIKNTIQSDRDTVLILGGEPLLYPQQVLEYIKGIRGHIKNIYLTTSLPITIRENADIVDEIIDLLDGLNVSFHHYNWKKNNEIFKASSKHNRVDMLEELLMKDSVAKKIRVSINLVNGQIDTKQKLGFFLDLMYIIGCKHVKINELQNVDLHTYVSFEDIMQIKMKSPYAYGCQTDATEYFDFYEGKMKVTLKRSCFVVKDRSISKVTFSDLLKAFLKRFIKIENGMQVMYENGQIENGWITKE